MEVKRRIGSPASTHALFVKEMQVKIQKKGPVVSVAQSHSQWHSIAILIVMDEDMETFRFHQCPKMKEFFCRQGIRSSRIIQNRDVDVLLQDKGLRAMHK